MIDNRPEHRVRHLAVWRWLVGSCTSHRWSADESGRPRVEPAMNRQAGSIGRWMWAFLIWSVTATTSLACNIPVFRYALERWQSDDYQVVVFANGAIDIESSNPLARALRQSDCNANCSYSDLTHQDAPHREVLQKAGGRPTDDHPYYVVLGPHQQGQSSIALHGVLSSDSASLVPTSPARQELSRRLLAGHAIVWLVLQTPDQDRNRTVSGRLRKAIAAIEGEIDLPEGIGLPGSELHSEVPLLLEFSMLEIEHDDQREAFLRQQLGRSQDEPVVVPVFGRGRGVRGNSRRGSKRLVDQRPDGVSVWSLFLSGKRAQSGLRPIA